MSRLMARSRRVNAAILAQIERMMMSMMMMIAMVYGARSDRSLHSKSTGQFLNGKKKDLAAVVHHTLADGRTDTHRAHK